MSAPAGESISYEEVEEWWEDSDYYMSPYPPSSWLAYCESIGADIEDLRDRADDYAPEVAELHANLETCPDCGNPHERSACIRTAAMCDCCAAIEKAEN